MSLSAKKTSISVIVPTYNRADFILNCVHSLQNCGFADLEIIVVDDGSTDNTSDLFRIPRQGVIYIHQQNHGVASARNLGFANSRGRYLAFLDSDDAWLPGGPQQLFELLERHPSIDLVFGDSRVGNPDEGYRSGIERFGQQEFFDLPHTRPEPGFRILERQPFFHRMLHRNAIFLGAAVMRRETFQRVGGFDSERFGTEDWELCLRISSQMTVGFWPEPVAVYTRHAHNLSGNRDQMLRDAYLSLGNLVQKCPHLTPGDKKIIRREYLYHLLGHAYLAYGRGDWSSTLRRFGKLLRECLWHPTGLLHGLACCVPFALQLSSSPKLWRKTSGKVVQ